MVSRLEAEPDQTYRGTYTGYRLLSTIALRALAASILCGAVAVLVYASATPSTRYLGIFAISAGAVFVILCAKAIADIATDYAKKKPLELRFGISVTWGSDSRHRKMLRVDCEACKLESLAVPILETVCVPNTVRRLAPGRFEGNGSLRPGGSAPSRFVSTIQLAIESTSPNESLVTIESETDETPGFAASWLSGVRFDLGRSIENVEELQSRLKRILQISNINEAVDS